MIFSITSVQCIFETLKLLQAKNSSYAQIYKEVGVSHETLQSALRSLVEKKLISKEGGGRERSEYSITDRGKKYFSLLKELKSY